MVTVVPTGPEVGEIEVMVGGFNTGTITVKVGPLAVPSGFVTDTAPVVAPVGTTKVIVVPFTIVYVTLVPFNLTEVAVEKFVPVIVTVTPTNPEVGLIDVIVGG